jgi:hypothetical protein
MKVYIVVEGSMLLTDKISRLLVMADNVVRSGNFHS